MRARRLATRRPLVTGRWANTLLTDQGAARAGKHFSRAVTLYTSALEVLPSAVLYANRAAANLALENCGAALADAESSVQLDATYIKAYYRRAAARFLLGKHAEALQDYRYVRATARRAPTALRLNAPRAPRATRWPSSSRAIRTRRRS